MRLGGFSMAFDDNEDSFGKKLIQGVSDALIGYSGYSAGDADAFGKISRTRIAVNSRAQREAAAYYNIQMKLAQFQYDQMIRQRRQQGAPGQPQGGYQGMPMPQQAPQMPQGQSGAPNISIPSDGETSPQFLNPAQLAYQNQQNQSQSAIPSSQGSPQSMPSLGAPLMTDVGDTVDYATGETKTTRKDFNADRILQEIQNLAPEKADNAQREKMATLVTSMQGIDNMVGFIKDFRPELEKRLGPFNPANWPGDTGQLVRRLKKDAVGSALAVNVESTFQAVRSAITGAQASAEELGLLRPLTPDMRDPLPVFMAKAFAFRKSAEMSLNGRLNILQATGVDTKAIRQLAKEQIKYGQETYYTELINNGIEPEEAKKLASSFSKESTKLQGGLVAKLDAEDKKKSTESLKGIFDDLL